jgi:hypothetical protein
MVRLAFQADGAAPPRVPDPPGIGVATIIVSTADVPAPSGTCVAGDPAVPAAYAIATGLPAAALDGSEVVIDQHGWLRAMVPPHTDFVQLANTLRDIAASPLAATPVPEHMHHHG